MNARNNQRHFLRMVLPDDGSAADEEATMLAGRRFVGGYRRGATLRDARSLSALLFRIAIASVFVFPGCGAARANSEVMRR